MFHGGADGRGRRGCASGGGYSTGQPSQPQPLTSSRGLSALAAGELTLRSGCGRGRSKELGGESLHMREMLVEAGVSAGRLRVYSGGRVTTHNAALLVHFVKVLPPTSGSLSQGAGASATSAAATRGPNIKMVWPPPPDSTRSSRGCWRTWGAVVMPFCRKTAAFGTSPVAPAEP